MADQILHYSDATARARWASAWIRHCQDYGLLSETTMGSLTTWAGLRAVIALPAPPAISFEAEQVCRQAIGDGIGRLGVLGTANAEGSLTDAMVADASGQSSGARIDRLCTLIAANAGPDAVDSTSRASFAMQV